LCIPPIFVQDIHSYTVFTVLGVGPSGGNAEGGVRFRTFVQQYLMEKKNPAEKGGA
jgi:hypothetical protein